jgi:hypothetical protein
VSQTPEDLPGLDPEQFVGGPPTGDEDPMAFTSGDQSTGQADGAEQGDQEEDAS